MNHLKCVIFVNVGYRILSKRERFNLGKKKKENWSAEENLRMKIDRSFERAKTRDKRTVT
jgi:hypothetical protein